MKLVDRYKDLILILVLFGLNCLIFSQIFPSFLFADDFYCLFVLKASSFAELLQKTIYLSFHEYFRPVLYLIIGIEYLLFHLNIPLLYSPCLAFQLINGYLIYLFILSATKDNRVGALSAVLFTVFPGNWEALGWMCQFTYRPMIAFVLLSFIFYQDHMKRSNNILYFISMIMFFMAFMCYEATAVFFVLLMFYALIVLNEASIRVIKSIVPYFIITISFILFSYLKGIYYPASSADYGLGWHLLPNMLDYLATLVIPATIQYKLSALIPSALINSIIWTKYSLYIMIPALTCLLLIKGPRPVKFFVLWPYVTLLPFIPFTTLHTSRYLYIPSIGFTALAAIFMVYLYDRAATNNRKKSVILISILLVLFYLAGMMLYQKVFYYKKEIRRQILSDFRRMNPKLDSSRTYYFIDLPIREDEIKYGIYLWYNVDKAQIRSASANELKALGGGGNALIFGYKDGKLVRIQGGH